MIHVVIILISVMLALLTFPGSVYLILLTMASMLIKHNHPQMIDQNAITPISIAVVIPAHNESINVLVAIQSLKNCEPPLGPTEIVVVADNCTDDTAAIAKKAGCRVLERHSDVNFGKGFALEFAFENLIDSGYDLFMVVDADTQCMPNIFLEFERKINEGAQVLQAPYFVGNKDGNGDEAYVQIVNIGFRAFNFLRPSAREKLGLSVGIFGTGFALTKHVLEKLPYRAHSIVEDIEYHINLVRHGYVSKFVPETKVTSTMPENRADAETQRSRWEGGRIRMILDWGWPLCKEVISGKWRLVDPLLELLLLPLWLHVSMLIFIIILFQPYFQMYGLIALLIVMIHVIAAILSTGGGIKELRTLLVVPKYMLWKYVIARSILENSDKKAKWNRTPRK